MYKKLLPLLFLLFSTGALAYDFPIEITEYIDNVKIVAYIDKKDIDKKLQWTPFNSSLPLSLTDALSAVQKYLDANSAFTGARFMSIELKQIPHHEKHWHYLVKVKYQLNGKIQPHFFVVLMDGKVISAIKQPEPIK